MSTPAVAKQPEFLALVQKSGAEFQKALGAVMASERFQRLIMTEFRTNEKLQRCRPESLLACCMQIAQAGLEVGGQAGEAYIVPFKEEAKVLWGYQGLLKLVMRSEEVQTVDTGTVYASDEFECEKGDKPMLRHKMIFPRGEPVLYYATAKLTNGGFLFEVMEVEEVEHIRRTYSRAADDDAWTKSFSQMARKTVLRRLIKLLPKSTQLKDALKHEEETEKFIVEHQERKPELVAKAAALPRGVSDAEREAAWEELEKLYTQCESLKIDTDDLPTKGYELYTTQEIFACLGVVRERLKTHGGQNGSGPKNP